MGSRAGESWPRAEASARGAGPSARRPRACPCPLGSGRPGRCSRGAAAGELEVGGRRESAVRAPCPLSHVRPSPPTQTFPSPLPRGGPRLPGSRRPDHTCAVRAQGRAAEQEAGAARRAAPPVNWQLGGGGRLVAGARQPGAASLPTSAPAPAGTESGRRRAAGGGVGVGRRRSKAILCSEKGGLSAARPPPVATPPGGHPGSPCAPQRRPALGPAGPGGGGGEGGPRPGPGGGTARPAALSAWGGGPRGGGESRVFLIIGANGVLYSPNVTHMVPQRSGLISSKCPWP